MSKKANPTLVGAFILGAVALTVAGVVIFGTGSFFRERPRAVTYFEGNVRGLNVGAPVNMRGVQVGQVTGIEFDLDVQKLEARIPVYVEFDPTSIRRVGSGKSGPPLLHDLVAKGLRAQLAAQSFVTGQLLVELDFFPDRPAYTVAADPSVPEIPTVKSEVEHLKDVLGRLPLQELVLSALKTVNSLDAVLSSPAIPATMASVAAATEDARALVASLRGNEARVGVQLTSLLDQTGDTLPELKKTLIHTQEVLKTTNEAIAPSVRATLRATEGAMRQAEKTLAYTEGMLAANSPQRADLNETLRNLSAASRSLRSLSDQLDRKPNALVVGR
jgi:paraquat-inducible protein B